jgi:hypothetical protein
MRKELLGFGLSMFLTGCASQQRSSVVYYDLEGINQIPGGVSAVLSRPGNPETRDLVKVIGNFGTSSIEIASSTILDSPLVVAWSGKAHINFERPFPFHILPPLDTANQKYHVRFTFYPKDSVRIQARAVPKSDCRHTIDHGATALSGFGPCVSDRGYFKLLDDLNNKRIPEPGPAVFPDD